MDPAVEALLAKLDAASAEHARAAVGWLLPDEASVDDLRRLGQLQLQEFLWYQLPVKWLCDEREHHEIAWSLGDLFEAAGQDRYARLCRADVTHRLIAEWEHDRERARADLQVALAESGVQPPDTPLLSWGGVMGLQEAAARYLTSAALEEAIAAGDLIPGDRGWKKRAARIADGFLTSPSPSFDGQSPLVAIQQERAERWASQSPPDWAAAVTPVLPLLAEEPVVPAAAADALAPLVWLLEQIGDGVTLTQTGRLPPVLVRAANDRFRWFELPGFSVRTETDVHELADLHDLGRRSRLLTLRGRRLSVSAAGRRALANPAELLRTSALAMVHRPGIEGEAAALAAALLLGAGDPVPKRDLRAGIGRALAPRWQTRDGHPLDSDQAGWCARDFLVVGKTLGWIHEEGDWADQRLALTPVGRAASLIGLRAQAFAARDRP